MLATILHALRGVFTLLVLGAYTIMLVALLMVLTLGKLLSPPGRLRDVFNRAAARLVESWIGLNNLVFALNRATRWDIEIPAALDRKGCYLVASNHQSWVDILALQKAFNRKLPILRFFIKRELIWVPFLGAAWWALDFPFMRRPSREEIARNPALKGKDLENARKACEKFRERPVAMMNFAEGTRFSAAKAKATGSPYRNLLKPKIGGVGIVLYALGDRLQALVDVTIAYPHPADTDYRPTFWQLVSGQIPKVVVRARELAIPRHLLGRNFRTDRDFRAELEAWFEQTWREKDALLSELKAS
jgi:1-acyl-sn-glycerol-3-phosphate acyltransferase